ncbi:Protein kinase domain-containing protein [Mycena kentingensis (nom. inval.)]|nr:Protein kinase domain-containing protein [Mycena kentingensis (nom. inval.)]
MDYLRSIGSTLVSAFEGVWTLYDATKRDDNTPVSVFEYDCTTRRGMLPLAKNALRKLKTMRHPDLLKLIDCVETETTIQIMTERVRPLQDALQTWASRGSQEREDWLLWGLHRVSVALAFINDSAGSTHGNIRVNSIFLSPSGEWKLGGLELLSNPKEDSAILYTLGGQVPDASSWASPEVRKGGWSVLKENEPSAADAYALGILLHAPQRQINAKRVSGLCAGLDNFALSSEADKNVLLRTLNETANSFPPEFASFRILPSLVSALEFGGASAATIVPLVIQFGKNVSAQDYSNVILAPLVKLFATPDRGTRWTRRQVDSKIWPHLQTGFADTVAVIREATVKAMSLIAPLLSDRILNNDLLRHLAKLQSDPEASIRTNTCILIGRLGPTLGYNTKRKVLVPAFSRALKDTFVHARVAGLMAFMATIDCFDVEDLASRVIPAMSLTLTDKEKIVRDQAFKAMELFVKKLAIHADTMPETAAPEASEALGITSPAQATLVNSAAGAAGALAGWAMSSLGKKLAKSDLETSIANVPQVVIERPASAPQPGNGIIPTSSLNGPSGIRSGVGSPTPSKGKSMQLGAHKVSAAAAAAALAQQLAEEAAADNVDGNPWGDDLMDVNADEDDWSAFETATRIANNEAEVDPWSTPTIPSKVVRATSPAFSTKSPPRAQTPASPAVQPSTWDSVGDWDEPKPAKAGPVAAAAPAAPLTKEEKAAEMARRKEERKQRIAQMKEQKRANAP